MIFYILLYQQLSLLSNMAAQRVKFLQSIDNPYLRITNEITQLQVQDARLHSNVLHLRQKIQSTRKQKTCQSCKIFEDEINMLKSNEKQKICRLQQSIFALQIQNESLVKEIYQLRQVQRERVNVSLNQVKALAGENLKNKEKQYKVAQMIRYEQNILKDIDQKAVTLRLKQKRQKDLLRKLKNRRGSIKVASDLISQIQSAPISGAVISHKKNSSYGDDYIQESSYQDSEPIENISELLEKISSLEKQNGDILKQLAQKDTEKQSSSMRIINLLGEIENSKKELQNMDDFYKNQCAILEQQKQKIVYELNMKFRNQQFQSNNLKMCLESSNREKDKLQYLKEIKENQNVLLKKENIVNQQIIITLKTAAESNKSHLNDCESKIKSLKQSNDNAQNLNMILKKDIQQQLLLIQSLQQKNQIILEQLQAQKQKNLNVLLQQDKDTQIHLINQIQNLKIVLSQNVNILLNKDQQITYLVSQLNKLVVHNQQLKLISFERQKSLALQQEKLYELNNINKRLKQQQQEKISSLQMLQIEKERIQADLSNQIKAKQQFIQKYKVAVKEKNDSYSKINSVQQQLEESKRILNLKSLQVQRKNQSIEYLSKSIIELKNETETLKKQNYSLKLDQEQSKSQLNAISNDLKLASSKSLGKLKQLELKQRQLQQLTYFNSQMHKDIQYFDNQNKILISKINDTEQIINDLERQNQNKVELLKKYQQQTIQLNSKIENSNKQINILRNTFNKSKTESDEQIHNLKNTISELVLQSDKMQHFFSVQQSSLKSQLNQSLSQNNQLIKQKEKLLKEINQKNTQNEQFSIINQKLNDKILSFESMYQKSLQQNVVNSPQKSFQSVLSLKDPLIDEQCNILQQKYEKSLDRIKSLESDKNHYKNNIDYLTERVQNLTKASSESSQAENQQLLRELNKKKAMISELLANFSFIQKQLKKKQSEFEELSAKHERFIKNTQKDKHDLSEKLSSKQTQIALLKKQREQANRLINQKQKQQQKLIQRLQQDNKVKDKQLAQQRKEKEKQKVRLADQKRKLQTSSSKQINILRESLESQKKKSQKSSLNSSPAKFEDQKKKETDQLKKIINQNLIKIRSLEKKLKEVQHQKDQFQQSLKHAQIEIKQLTQHLAEVSVNLDIHKKQMQQLKATIESLQKSVKVAQETKKIFLQKNEALESALSLKQKQLLQFSHKYKRLDAKCQKLMTQCTQKDISYDCLWNQLDKAQSTISSLQKKLDDRKQQNLTTILSQQTPQHLPIDIKDSSKLYLEIPNFVEKVLIKESNAKDILNFKAKQLQCPNIADKDIEGDKIISLDKKEEDLNQQLVAQIPKKESSKSIMLQGHGDLSEVISEAQKNDEYNDISDRLSHHSSNVERTLEAISEYSRIKSARSDLTNKEVQDQYKSKMKNSKMMAKFKSTRKR